jgi:hypothetical protein
MAPDGPLGEWSGCAGFGGNFSLPWLPHSVMRQDEAEESSLPRSYSPSTRGLLTACDRTCPNAASHL